MRLNAFNEPIFESGDDFFAAWTMHFDEEPDGEIARFLEEDPEFKWSCEITDNNDRSAQAHNFETEESLRAWLTKNKIEIEG